MHQTLQKNLIAKQVSVAVSYDLNRMCIFIGLVFQHCETDMFCFLSFTGIQEGNECTKCKNDWALRAAIALLFVLCALLTIAVAVLGYKGKNSPFILMFLYRSVQNRSYWKIHDLHTYSPLQMYWNGKVN